MIGTSDSSFPGSESKCGEWANLHRTLAADWRAAAASCLERVLRARNNEGCSRGCRVIPARASFEMFAFATTQAAARVATRVTTGDRACTSSARRVAPRPVRGASHVVRAGEGNPFVEGWLDLSATVTGGGADLGVSELAENLGSDVYMDINGWCAPASRFVPSAPSPSSRDPRQLQRSPRALPRPFPSPPSRSVSPGPPPLPRPQAPLPQGRQVPRSPRAHRLAAHRRGREPVR